MVRRLLCANHVIVALILFFLSNQPFAPARDKLFVVEGGPEPSFVFAGRRGASLATEDALPAQLRRALERSKALVLAEPTWDRAGMMAKIGVPNESYLTGHADLRERLSPEAKRVIRRLTSAREQRLLCGARPGMVLTLIEALFTRRVSVLADEAASAADPDVGPEVSDLTRALFGRVVPEDELARMRARVEHPRGTTVTRYDHTFYKLARGRNMSVDALLRFEAVGNLHDLYDRLINVDELDRALRFLGERLAVEARLRRVRDDLRILINARYLTTKNQAIQNVCDRALVMKTPGRDRLNHALLARHRDWRSALSARFATEGTFVAVPLETVMGNKRLGIPGLRQLLKHDGFEVTPVELGCGPLLH